MKKPDLWYHFNWGHNLFHGGRIWSMSLSYFGFSLFTPAFCLSFSKNNISSPFHFWFSLYQERPNLDNGRLVYKYNFMRYNPFIQRKITKVIKNVS